MLHVCHIKNMEGKEPQAVVAAAKEDKEQPKGKYVPGLSHCKGQSLQQRLDDIPEVDQCFSHPPLPRLGYWYLRKSSQPGMLTFVIGRQRHKSPLFVRLQALESGWVARNITADDDPTFDNLDDALDALLEYSTGYLQLEIAGDMELKPCRA